MAEVKLTRWDVIDYLDTEEDMALYLDACMEEDSGDGALIRTALNNIARAKGMGKLAESAGMTRQGLYKALSSEGNPSFTTVIKIIKALGVKLHVQAAN